MKTKKKEWQVQILVDDQWFGYAFTDYDYTSKRDAERTANIARQKGHTARVVEVKPE